MARLFIEASRLADPVVVLSGEDHRYLMRVLRLGLHDRVVLFDGVGVEAHGTVVRIGPRALEVHIDERKAALPTARLEMTLLQSLGKGDKLDLVVQKATELGVARIMPMTSARSIPQLDALRAGGRRLRWQKIAREASRQSGRIDVPEIGPVTSLSVALSAAPKDALKLMLWESERQHQLRSVMPATAPAQVVIAVGPEGGFADEEVAQARATGFVTVGLGPRILRTETAALVALAIVGFALGDLG